MTGNQSIRIVIGSGMMTRGVVTRPIVEIEEEGVDSTKSGRWILIKIGKRRAKLLTHTIIP